MFESQSVDLESVSPLTFSEGVCAPSTVRQEVLSGVSHSCVSLYQDELMAELEELEQEELDKNLLEISGPETVPLPNVPSIALPSKPSEYSYPESDTPAVLCGGCFCGQLLRVENQIASVVMAPETVSPALSSFSLERRFLTLALLT